MNTNYVMGTGNDERVKTLVDAGLIHPRCRRFKLELEAGGCAMLTQEVFVTAEEFDALAGLIPYAEPKTTVVHEQHQDAMLDVTPLGPDWKEKIRKR